MPALERHNREQHFHERAFHAAFDSVREVSKNTLLRRSPRQSVFTETLCHFVLGEHRETIAAILNQIENEERIQQQTRQKIELLLPSNP